MNVLTPAAPDARTDALPALVEELTALGPLPPCVAVPAAALAALAELAGDELTEQAAAGAAAGCPEVGRLIEDLTD